MWPEQPLAPQIWLWPIRQVRAGFHDDDQVAGADGVESECIRISDSRRGTSGQCWPGSHLLHLPFVGVQQSGFLGQIPVSLLQMAGNPLWLTQINEFIPAAWAKARAGKVVAQAA